MEEQTSYRVPEKLLVDRDPIILNKLSMREAGQWLVFLAVSYLVFSYLPADFTIKLMIISVILLAGYCAIHQQFNGLTGYEWVRVFLAYRKEKGYHSIKGQEKTEQKIIFSVKGGLNNNGTLNNQSEPATTAAASQI